MSPTQQHPGSGFSSQTDLDSLCDLAIIDLRNVAAYVRGHRSGATHIPLHELEKKQFLLPDKTYPLALFGPPEALNQAQNFLRAKGYAISHRFIADDYLRASHPPRNLETGEGSRRLWQPMTLIKDFVGEHVACGQAIDLGCGAGRDSVYLAMHGWQVTAVDYLPGALAKARQLAMTQAVKIKTVADDIESRDGLVQSLKQNEWLEQFDLLLVARFLHRPLFPAIKKLLKPGGFVIYQTFMRGCEQFGSPKNPNFLLEHGELSGIFDLYKILHDRVEHLADGRPVSYFVAQKPLE